MKIVKKIAAAALIAASLIPASASAWNVPDESLSYSVRFRWGFIDANVGIAQLSTQNIPGENRFEATLNGRSIDLFGHYYAASDKIVGSIMADNIQQTSSAQIYDENGQFAIQTVTYDAQGPSKDGPVVQDLGDGKVLRSRTSNYGSGLTIDLLSAFYYMRQVNYADYQPGQTFRININNATSVDYLDIAYEGQQTINVGGEQRDAYYITLSFSASNSSATDNLKVWISTDDSRVPLYIKGSVSVGEMECTLVNETDLGNLQ